MADPIKTAEHIFDQFLSKADPASLQNYDPNAKDPQAQSAGQKGASKGGRIRAQRLSTKRRSEIAELAAHKRWEKAKG